MEPTVGMAGTMTIIAGATLLEKKEYANKMEPIVIIKENLKKDLKNFLSSSTESTSISIVVIP